MSGSWLMMDLRLACRMRVCSITYLHGCVPTGLLKYGTPSNAETSLNHRSRRVCAIPLAVAAEFGNCSHLERAPGDGVGIHRMRLRVCQRQDVRPQRPDGDFDPQLYLQGKLQLAHQRKLRLGRPFAGPQEMIEPGNECAPSDRL